MSKTATMKVRTAGFVKPVDHIQFEINSHKYRCGAITNGVCAYLDGERYGGVMDFADLCAVVDAIRAARAKETP